MYKSEIYARCATALTATLLVVIMSACGNGDEILGHPGPGGVPGAPPGAIIPGATCSASAGPTIPTVTSSNPLHGTQNVTTSTVGVAGGGKSITATFNMPMAAATLNATNISLSPVGGSALTPASVTANPSATVVTLTTSSALLPDTAYTAVITRGVTSAGGTPPGCVYAFNFRTTPVPAAGPSAINLGLAAPFAIAASAGITNSGATKINGDVVLNPNQTCNAVAVGSGNDFGACGANPPTHNAGDRVITQIFPDTITADAVMADLNATFLSLAPASMPGATVLGCGTIGSLGDAGAGTGCNGNATLPPGVYISLTSTSIGISGVLTLDAAGNGNAEWVFQAPSSTVITASGSSILLINGAKASNVWWYVGSSATLNAGTSFQGNILAGASISMGTLSTSCGRLLAGAIGAGAFSFLSNTVSVPGNPNAPPICQ